jgi:two-component system sensor histidine kinase AgrC
MDIIDLCVLVGIWLDNAIEAALTSSSPRLKVGIIKKDNLVFLVITNTVGDMPALFKLREDGFSTKGTDRGIGLRNVRKLLNNYDHITNDMVFEADEFRQVLEIHE